MSTTLMRMAMDDFSMVSVCETNERTSSTESCGFKQRIGRWKQPLVPIGSRCSKIESIKEK